MTSMIEAFKPDIFSDSTQTFHAATEDMVVLVSSILREYYPNLIGPPSVISKVGGLELNSSNFRFTVGDENFLLKLAGTEVKQEVLITQFRISEMLRSRRVQLPAVLANREGQYVSRGLDGRCWVVMRFVDGSYFTGGIGELLNVGKGIGQLHRYLFDHALTDIKVNNFLVEMSFFQVSLTRLFECQSQWLEIFPEQPAQLLNEDANLLKKTAARIVAKMPTFAQLPNQVCHCDLHPHNILVHSGQLAAFVDIDSLKIGRRAQALAFSTFKLLRQHAVYSGLDTGDMDEIASAAAHFVGAIREEVELVPVELENLEDLALYEIFGRILIISNLNILRRDFTWNHVLNMHLAALREIPIIFAHLSVNA